MLLLTRLYSRLLSNPKLMKLLGTVLGFELGDSESAAAAMDMDNDVNMTKKETSTASSKSNTTTNKPTEQKKPAVPEQSPVRCRHHHCVVLLVHIRFDDLG
jgi:hypothetical protein